MIREATIEIADQHDGTMLFRLLRTRPPVTYPKMHQYRPLQVPAGSPPLSTATIVTQYGDELRKALATHAAVTAELTQIFGTPAPGLTTLEFTLSADADCPDVRWETLYEAPPAGFLAVNGRCSVKRLVSSAAATSTLPIRLFSAPLKLAAYLSPANVKAKEEFYEIIRAVGAARQKGLDIVASIYLGEQELLDAAQDDAAAGKLPGVTLQQMPSDAVSIEKSIIAESAQILHFFCHGHSKAGLQLLEFASINDHDIEEPTGSILLSIERLTEVLAGSGSIWMTILNSCSGAQSAPKLFSMARALAAAASPVAIGMAEPIRDVDATLFASAFYEKAFDAIRDAVNPLGNGATATIDLGPAVAHARSRLHAEAQLGPEDTFGRWSLPILYQQERGLKVCQVENAADMVRRIDQVATTLRAVASSGSSDLADAVLAILNKEPAVPVQLRPDRAGNFA